MLECPTHSSVLKILFSNSSRQIHSFKYAYMMLFPTVMPLSELFVSSRLLSLTITSTAPWILKGISKLFLTQNWFHLPQTTPPLVIHVRNLKFYPQFLFFPFICYFQPIRKSRWVYFLNIYDSSPNSYHFPFSHPGPSHYGISAPSS